MSATVAPALSSPFRGLAPFGDSDLDALLFFGRERETEVAVANLIASRLTVLFGPSGVGKTSLLRAGVARRLRELAQARAVDAHPDAAVVVFSSWAEEPVARLAEAIAGEVAPLAPGTPPPPAGSSLAEACEHWSAVLDGELYLVLDQLEEYFVYHGNEPGQGPLITELPPLVSVPSLRVHVLLSLREDALALLEVFKERLPNVFGNQLRLDRLDRRSARAAVLGPVQRWNDLVDADDRVTIEPQLVEDVLAQAASGADADRIEPPYLQLVMERVWHEERERGSRVLRQTTLADLGGAGAIVRDHLDRALAVLGEEDQDAAARMFEHLVTPSGTKIAHRASDLAQFAHLRAGEAEPVLGALGRERILRPLDATDGDRYEIFHDVLAEAILEWRRRRELEQERAVARRRFRRLAALAGAAFVALVVMTGVSVYALSQRREAREQEQSARARALAGNALSALDDDPELSLLLARNAARISDAPQVEDVLRAALIASRVRAVAHVGAPVQAVQTDPASPNRVVATAKGRIVTIDGANGRIVDSINTGAPRVVIDPVARTALAYGPNVAPVLVNTASGAHRTLQREPAVGGSFSPDGRLLVTLHKRTVRLWVDGRLQHTIPVAAPARVAVVNSDGLIAVSAQQRKFVVYNGMTGARVRVFHARGVVTRLVFGPSGKIVAAVVADKIIRLYDARRGSLLRTFDDDRPVVDLAFSPRADLLATASTDGDARVWSAASTNRLLALLVGHTNYVLSVDFSRNGSFLVTAGRDGEARAWNAKGPLLAVLRGHREPVRDAAFTADGRIVTASDDGTVRIWNPQAHPELKLMWTGKRSIAAARFAGAGVVVAPPGGVDVAVGFGGDRWVTAVGREVTVRDTATRDVRARFSVPAHVSGVAMARSGEIAVSSADGYVRLYSASGDFVRRFDEDGGAPTRGGFSPDGRLFAAGSTDDTAKIWEVRSGRLVRTLTGHSDRVTSARFSHDGRFVVTGSRDHDVRVWEVETGHRIHLLDNQFATVQDAAFSPDDKWIVVAGPKNAALYAAHTGRFLFYLRGHTGPVTSASFDSASRRIVTSGEDGTVRSYACEVCGSTPRLLRLATKRLTATHRRLTTGERARYVP